MNNHTTARRGQRVHVILHSGQSFTDKLVEIRSRFYVFESAGKVFYNTVRSFAIGRNRFPGKEKS